MRKLGLVVIILLAIIASSCQSPKISRDWTSFVQTIDVQAEKTKNFKVIAHVKVDTQDDRARAGVWVRVDNKAAAGSGFFDNMSDRPIPSSNWDSYTIEGTISANSKSLSFGGICYNNGDFYFDHFEVFIEDDNGVFQSVTIQNPSFETKVKDGMMPGWEHGIGKPGAQIVKEFSYSSVQDSRDGDLSAVIKGVGITEQSAKIDEKLSNVGTFIVLVFLTVFLFSLLTHVSSTESNDWSMISKYGFRFSFLYFFLYIILNNNGAYPFFQDIFGWLHSFLKTQVLSFGKNVLGLTDRISTSPTGSGDTTYDYVVMFAIFSFSFFGSLFWSLVDRKRKNYKTLYYILTTGIRYYVALMLMHYGLVKVVQLQFPAPSLYRLIEPYGESSPMGLAWTFLGFSKGYNMFMGIAELCAGLLLFRRTLVLGAVITAMTTLNVMAVNYFFDVPVKALSTHLFIMTMFLLSRDLWKVLKYLLTDMSVEKLSVIPRPQLKKGINTALIIFKVGLLIYIFQGGIRRVFESEKQFGSKAPKTYMYGLYKVNSSVVNGDTLYDYRSDLLWKDIRIEREGSASVRKMNESRTAYTIVVDSIGNKIQFTSRSDTSDHFDLYYAKTDSTMDFNYIINTDTIVGTTTRLGPEDFLLTSRGFRWVNERPYNR